jgi:hypothetical protein
MDLYAGAPGVPVEARDLAVWAKADPTAMAAEFQGWADFSKALAAGCADAEEAAVASGAARVAAAVGAAAAAATLLL